MLVLRPKSIGQDFSERKPQMQERARGYELYTYDGIRIYVGSITAGGHERILLPSFHLESCRSIVFVKNSTRLAHCFMSFPSRTLATLILHHPEPSLCIAQRERRQRAVSTTTPSSCGILLDTHTVVDSKGGLATARTLEQLCIVLSNLAILTIFLWLSQLFVRISCCKIKRKIFQSPLMCDFS